MTKSGTSSVRLYISEEQELYRDLYHIVFGENRGLDDCVEVCGISGSRDAGTIREEMRAAMPDVVLLGMRNLEKGVFDLIDAVRVDCPRIGAVVMAVSFCAEDIQSARRFASSAGGAIALFLKQSLSGSADLRGIIRAVARGQTILDPSVVNYLFAEKPEDPFVKQLTARELEVLSLLSQGFTNIAISERLFADIKTVENHINTLYSQLRVEADMEQRNPRVMATRAYLCASDIIRRDALAGVS